MTDQAIMSVLVIVFPNPIENQESFGTSTVNTNS